MELLPGVEAIEAANLDAMQHYQPKPYHRPIVYFSARQSRPAWQEIAFEDAWQKIALGGFEICDIPGDHTKIFREPYAQILAEKLKDSLDRVLIGK